MLVFVSVFFSGIASAQKETIGSLAVEAEKIAVMEMGARGGQSFGLDGYSIASSNFDVSYYRCEWSINPAIKYIKGNVTSYFRITGAGMAITFDLHADLMVDSVRYHGGNISFNRSIQHGVTINFPTPINAGVQDSVTIYYQGIPDAANTGVFVHTTHAGVPVIWTLSEPYGSKDWWPCKNGLDDKADSLDVIVTCPQQFVPSSNGVIAQESVSGGMRSVYFKHRYPVASYLVAVAVTNYVVWQGTANVNGKTLPLRSYYYPENLGLSGNENYTKHSMEEFSKLFGDYPFVKEKYGHTQCSFNGGMEHQTNSFMGVYGFSIIAHELGHQWFGDQVTCGSWSDIWLNEGFATYCQHIYAVEYLFPHAALGGLGDLAWHITSQPGGSVYVSDTTSRARIFDSRLSYNKGFYVIYMLRGVLGDSVFYRGVRRYLQDPKLRFGYARTEDFKRNMELESGKDLSTFFKNWVYGEGYPNYQVNWQQNSNQWIRFQINQTTSHTSVPFYEMPVQLLFRGGGKDSLVKVDHRYNGQEFYIQLPYQPDTVIIDPRLWILSKVKTSKKITGSSVVNELKIYPNPSPGDLRVSLNNPTYGKISLQLFNTSGQQFYYREYTLNGRDETWTIPMQPYARGTYYLRVKTPDNSLKVLKKIIH